MTKKNGSSNSRYGKVLKAILELDGELPLHFLDVGARGGLATATEEFEELKRIPGFRAYGIEPDPEECHRLEATGEYHTVLPIAIWNRNETCTLYVTRNPACASLLKPNAKHNAELAASGKYDVMATAKVVCKRIDEVLPGQQFDLIKTDVQGATFEALESVGDGLHETLACWIDLYFEQVYEGQKLFDAGDALLRQHGFRMVTFRPVSTDGIIRQGNFLYVRQADQLRDRRSFLKLMVIVAVLRNLALVEYLIRVHNRGFLNSEEAASILDAGELKLKDPAKSMNLSKWPKSTWGGLLPT